MGTVLTYIRQYFKLLIINMKSMKFEQMHIYICMLQYKVCIILLLYYILLCIYRESIITILVDSQRKGIDLTFYVYIYAHTYECTYVLMYQHAQMLMCTHTVSTYLQSTYLVAFLVCGD